MQPCNNCCCIIGCNDTYVEQTGYKAAPSQDVYKETNISHDLCQARCFHQYKFSCIAFVFFPLQNGTCQLVLVNIFTDWVLRDNATVRIRKPCQRELGAACISDDDCVYLGGSCRNNQCGCAGNGFNKDVSLKICKRSVGYSCLNDVMCTGYAWCDNKTCVCSEPYVTDGKHCTEVTNTTLLVNVTEYYTVTVEETITYEQTTTTSVETTTDTPTTTIIVETTTDPDICLSNPCLNYGSCMSSESEYTCICPAGFYGANCGSRCAQNEITYNSNLGTACLHPSNGTGTYQDVKKSLCTVNNRRLFGPSNATSAQIVADQIKALGVTGVFYVDILYLGDKYYTESTVVNTSNAIFADLSPMDHDCVVINFSTGQGSPTYTSEDCYAEHHALCEYQASACPVFPLSDTCFWAIVSEGHTYSRRKRAIGDNLYTYNEAIDACRAAGGELARLNDSSRVHHIDSVFPNQTSPYWIGLSRAPSTTTFKWHLSNKQLSSIYANWAAGYPVTGELNCVAAALTYQGDIGSSTFRADHHWQNVDCAERYAVLCEKEMTYYVPTPAPTTTPTEIPETNVTAPAPAPDVDPTTEYFELDIDLEELPWFSPTPEPTVELTNVKNLSSVLTEIPLENRRAMGHQIQDMLQECTWNGKNCNPTNFTGFTNKYYGNCYTFNSGEYQQILNVSKPGQLYGLTLTLYIQQNQYVKSLASGAGIRVSVHRQDQQPFPEDEGFNINPGMKTTVKLNLAYHDRLEYPYSNCTYGNGKELMYTKNYSVMACQKSCLQKIKIRDCGCADSMLPVPSTANSVCATAQESSCIDNIDDKFGSGGIACDCTELCSDYKFVPHIISSFWPGDAALESVRDQFINRSEELREVLSHGDGLTKNFLKIEVYYEEVKYEKYIDRDAYGIENLLGDIGGQLGLWIGISVLTLAEIVQLVFDIITACCRKAENENRVDVEDEKKIEEGKIGIFGEDMSPSRGLTPIEMTKTSEGKG